MDKLSAGLYIVPTPIGNMGDVSPRVRDTLASADIVACEDTRRTGMLLKNLDIKANRLMSYHEHNEKSRAESLAEEIAKGRSVALASDAGMPGISDPGYRIIQSCIERDLPITPLPGPTAFVPALVASGLPFDKFTFMGFPPQKKGRKTFLESATANSYTTIFYESPYRVVDLFERISQIDPDRNSCAAREISKIHEEFIRGTAEYIYKELSARDSIKGEFVIIIDGKKD
ncbi:MAG: 16S rRNA (cytidine(1402)-2'-O)-methyltransferase [Candidatus Kapaibacterium sp.]